MPQAITYYLQDYTLPPYLVEQVELFFELDDALTIVRAKSVLRRRPGGTAVPLVLDGQMLVIRQLRLDGRPLAPHEYQQNEESLTLHQVPEAFTLEVETAIQPVANTALEGLYASSGNLCTQCEAEGFRRITYYPDRPDVMARFTTTLTGDKIRYPVLLSNGNLEASGDLADGRHWARWVDPFPKPCYLFALVAGDLTRIADRYTTQSGREVDLHLYVQHRNAHQCDHAMTSLKKAMAWDEQVYGREYDLAVYQIVAVDDFNMGAMENKGLNIFNSRYVLARPETATDDDFEAIEGVIAHEYFHNWSGNRVTCRDWFQLSLKEGFTVFRDQEFTADMTSRAVKRIRDVQRLRTAQFREDSGPLAHPVRPTSYQEINNFYTVTVYEKGAEVVRMIHRLLGATAFRQGTDCYFTRHDGQAVTTDDFVQAMEDTTGVDLGQFRRWYSQAGTPQVTGQGQYDGVGNRYILTLQQSCSPTPNQATKKPFHIPLAMGLVGPDGQDLPLRLAGEPGPVGTSRVLELRTTQETFVFEGITAPPIPSLLRGFSAPVKLVMDYPDDALAFLMAHDSDLFNRWEAGQRLTVRIFLRLLADYADNRPLVMPPAWGQAMGQLLENDPGDRRLVAEALTLPSEAYLAEQVSPVDPTAIHTVRRFLRTALANCWGELFLATYQANHDPEGAFRADEEAIGQRRLKNVCLSYLLERDDASGVELAYRQFQQANNMTDAITALGLLANQDSPVRQLALDTFYDRWHHDPLVLDKWFSLQATSRLPGTLAAVQQLLTHPEFRLTNPNKVRALIGAFSHGNSLHFHDPSGSGYTFLAQQVLTLDPLNPQIAARLLNAMSDWRRYEPHRRRLLEQQLQRILATPQLSKDVTEIAGKSLGS